MYSLKKTCCMYGLKIVLFAMLQDCLWCGMTRRKKGTPKLVLLPAVLLSSDQSNPRIFADITYTYINIDLHPPLNKNVQNYAYTSSIWRAFVTIRKPYISFHVDLQGTLDTQTSHDDVIKWKHFPRYWPFVRGIHRSPVNSPHKGQWHGFFMFSLICVWINGWVNNRRQGWWFETLSCPLWRHCNTERKNVGLCFLLHV